MAMAGGEDEVVGCFENGRKVQGQGWVGLRRGWQDPRGKLARESRAPPVANETRGVKSQPRARQLKFVFEESKKHLQSATLSSGHLMQRSGPNH